MKEMQERINLLHRAYTALQGIKGVSKARELIMLVIQNQEKEKWIRKGDIDLNLRIQEGAELQRRKGNAKDGS